MSRRRYRENKRKKIERDKRAGQRIKEQYCGLAHGRYIKRSLRIQFALVNRKFYLLKAFVYIDSAVKFTKRTVFLDTCASCSELPSYISSLVSPLETKKGHEGAINILQFRRYTRQHSCAFMLPQICHFNRIYTIQSK